MAGLIRHPVKFILDSGFRRKDNLDIYYYRSNNNQLVLSADGLNGIFGFTYPVFICTKI